jgi:DeoR/GlpR family transcriptional regulator of sugar metabolism
MGHQRAYEATPLSRFPPELAAGTARMSAMDATPAPLIPAQRREELMRHLRRAGVLSVRQLMEILSVSHMTVRRDIATLEREGRAHTIPGGVRLASALREEPPYAVKLGSEHQQKLAIAACAEGFLHDGMTVYLDAGTTTGALVPGIVAHKDMTVITNDFAISAALMESGSVEIIQVGGRIESLNRSTVGDLAAKMLAGLNTDLAFLSTSSWDMQRGLTTPNESKIGPKLAAIATSSCAMLLASSSKFGRVGLYTVVPLTTFDRIITDQRLSSAAAQGIRDLGIEIDLV